MKTFAVLVALSSVLLLSGCPDQGTPKDPPPAPQTAHAQPPADSKPALGAVDPNAPLPPGHPAINANSASSLPPVPEGAGSGETALAWTTPAGWVSVTPSSTMRRAQYRVPGKAGDGECAVFYFGPGQGGDPMANAQRWAGQFTLPDGQPATSAMKTSQMDVGGLKVTIVEVAGTYSGGMTMGTEPAKPQPGYRLLGAVAPGPDANWFFKLTGPDATVVEQRGAFESMVKSLKHGV
ncbi:MAG TPA: hypothetical protein VFV19_06710 [Candidatus Polarisedimenticolaceae bacterium]|nr:hypothetical protein [Candidatus Polarisedimenticolaceae bacterium]